MKTYYPVHTIPGDHTSIFPNSCLTRRQKVKNDHQRNKYKLSTFIYNFQSESDKQSNVKHHPFWWVRVLFQIDTPKGAGPQEAILFPTSRNLWVGLHHKTKTNGWKAKQKVFSSWSFYTIPSRSILQLPGFRGIRLVYDVSRVGVFHYPSCTIASKGVAPCGFFTPLGLQAIEAS